MNNIDLPALIRDCVDGGTRPVTPGEIKARAVVSSRPAAGPRRVPVRLAVTVTGVAAAGAAAGLVASQSGSGLPSAHAVLTAAVIKHMAGSSQAAMTSGQADIDWTSNGQPSVIQQISFDGANWNDVLNPGVPMKITRTGKFISQTGESIDRVVDGRFYHYPAFRFAASGPKFTPGWMRMPASAGSGALTIPDPRTLLSVLSPAAGFVADGTGTVNGVAVSHLRATTPSGVPAAPLDGIIQSEPDNAAISAIDLWVDASDVVQQAKVTLSGTNGSGVAQSVTVTVTFSQIGQLQPITPPSTYTAPGAKG